MTCVCDAHQVLVERDQKHKLLQFLMGLHDSNATVRGQILMMSPLPSVSQDYAYVKQDEKARQGYQQSANQINPFVNALVSNSGNSSLATSHTGVKKSGSVLKCSYCNFNGHTKENCYKLIGYPPNWKKKKDTVATPQAGAFRSLPTTKANAVVSQTDQSGDKISQMQQQIAQLSQMMTFFVGTGKPSNSPEDHLAGMVTSKVNLVSSTCSQYAWLIDIGATDHMCFNLSMLKDVRKLQNFMSLALPTGSSILVDTVGTFVIHPKLHLVDVFFMPSCNYNLLSVSKWVMQTGGSVSFMPDSCQFLIPSEKGVIATGKFIDGLYHLEFQPVPPNHNSVPFRSINSILSKNQLSALWHMRLGHVSSPILSKIPGVSDSVMVGHNQLCPLCPLSKQTNLPFSLNSSRASHAFDLIHVDVWGPYAHDVHNGCRFFLTIIDDHTRNIWTYLLPSKHHVIFQLKSFFAFVENQFRTTIKCFRSDHGTEFFNKDFLDFLLDKGVVQ